MNITLARPQMLLRSTRNAARFLKVDSFAVQEKKSFAFLDIVKHQFLHPSFAISGMKIYKVLL